MENGLNRIVGTATLFDSNLNYQPHIKILDFFVHPNYWEYAADLLNFIIKEDAKRTHKKIISYISSCDKEKIDWLKKLKFQAEVLIPNYFQKGEKKKEKSNLFVFSLP